MTTSKVRHRAASSPAAVARAGHARRSTAVAAVKVMPVLRNVRRLIVTGAPPTVCSAFLDYIDGRRSSARLDAVDDQNGGDVGSVTGNGAFQAKKRGNAEAAITITKNDW